MVRRQDGDQLMVLITMLLTAILLLGESSAPVVEPLEVPCGERSHLPNLAMGADGNIYLSWVEPLVGGGDRLRFSLYRARAGETRRRSHREGTGSSTGPISHR